MENVYRTSDGDLVAYLNYRGFKLESAEPENQARSIIFTLKNSPQLSKEIDSFYNDTATVNPRAYSDQIKKIRVIISTAKRNAAEGGDR